MSGERTLTQIAEELERHPKGVPTTLVGYPPGTVELLCDALRIAVRRGNFMASTQRDIERILTAVAQ